VQQIQNYHCVRLLTRKSNWKVPYQCLDFITKILLDVTPTKENLATNYYDARRLLLKLGLEAKRIYYCVKGCTLFYDNEYGKMMEVYYNVNFVISQGIIP